MDRERAERILNETRMSGNPSLLATATFRDGVLKKLSRDHHTPAKGESEHTVVEIHLTEKLPGTHFFFGIFEVDEQGIWFHDGDGDINGPVLRQRLIPWKFVKTLVIHR